MVRTGDQKLIQELNRTIVLDMIRKHGPVSRSDIAKQKQMSPTTVASAVQELIHEGFVREIGNGLSSGGRKPILVSFVPEVKTLIAVSIDKTSITIAEMDLAATALRKQVYPVTQFSGETAVAAVLDSLQDFTKSVDPARCAGISVITPGIVDARQGVVLYNAKFKWRDLPLRSMIEKRFPYKVLIENDTSAMVLAEKRFGPYDEFNHLCYVTIGEGVGAGIMVHDTLLHGGTGELGHISIDRGGMKCDCGNIGCLEHYASWAAVYSQILSEIARGKQTLISEMTEGSIAAITPAVFGQAAAQGDPVARQITREIGDYLGAAIVHLVNLCHPQAIILGGDLVWENEYLLACIRDYVFGHAMRVLQENLKIEASTLGKEKELIGAAALLLEDFFRFSIHT